MAWTTVKLVFGGSASSDHVSGPQEVMVYRCISDEPISKFAALTATDGVTAVPDDLDDHPDDDRLKVTNKSVNERSTRDGAGLIFDVNVTYSIPTRNFTNNPGGSGTNNWNHKVSVRGIEYTENTNQDVTGKPILNSYGDIYPSSIPKTFWDEEIIIEFDTDDIVALAEDLCDVRGKINSAGFTMTLPTRDGGTYTRVFLENQIKGGNVAYHDEVDASGNLTWHVTLPLLFRTNVIDGEEQGWKLFLVDRGRRWKDAGGNTVLNPQGVERALNGSGALLAGGADAVLRSHQIDIFIDIGAILTAIGA